MKLNNYPSYKPCNIDWCRLIPDQWSQAQLRVCIDFATNGLSCNQTEQTATTAAISRIETISEGKFNFEKVGYIERPEADPRRLMRKGDLAFSNINSLSMIGNCAILDSDEEIYAGMNLLHVRPKQTVDPKWLYWLMRSNSFRSDVESNSKPAINQASIPQSKLVSIQIPIPQSKSEQSKISRFLDCETAKIDALIAEQERLIDLLQEKRQAVISHAVTKGLNPNAPMKDSGVEWLGEVPEHWEVKPLKYVTNQISVGVVVEPSKYYSDQGSVPALRSLNIKPGRIILDNCVYITQSSNEILRKSKLRSGDLVVVRSGQPGTCAVVPEELDNCNCIDLIFMRKPKNGDSKFLMLSLSSDFSFYQYGAGAEGAIQQHFNVKTASELIIPWPLENEQREIKELLEQEVSKIDHLSSQVEQSITLLKERRSALISAAVRGQIDVRGLVSEEVAA